MNQPTAETGLVVASTDDADTAQSVTVEDEGAATAETVPLDGTTQVAIVGPFAHRHRQSRFRYGRRRRSIDQRWERGRTHPGNATRPDPWQGHQQPAGLDTTRRRLGVPALGAGSHENEVQPQGSRTWFHFRGDRIERVGGAQIGPRINSATLSADNNVDSNERQKSTAMAINRGVLDITLEGSIAGPRTTTDAIMDHLQTTGADIEWEFFNGQVLKLPKGVVTEPGELAPESSQVAMYVDTTFQGQGVQLLDDQGTVIAPVAAGN